MSEHCPLHHHVVAAMIRMFTQIIIAILPMIHPWVRIVLILFTDVMDTAYLNFKCNHDSGLTYYKYHDKINDLLGYVLCCLVITKYSLLPKWKLYILYGAIALRIPQLPMYNTLGDYSFVVFPDLFKELLIALLLLPHTKPSLSIVIPIVAIVICCKALFEYTLHVKKNYVWRHMLTH